MTTTPSRVEMLALDRDATVEAAKALCKHTGLFVDGFNLGKDFYVESLREEWRNKAIAAAECVVRAYLAVSASDGVQPRIPDGQQCNEQSAQGLSRASLDAWRIELDEVVGHLGAAIMQSVPADDQIIMDHVKAAHEIARIVRRRA